MRFIIIQTTTVTFNRVTTFNNRDIDKTVCVSCSCNLGIINLRCNIIILEIDKYQKYPYK